MRRRRNASINPDITPRKMDKHGFYSGPDESTEARFHGYATPKREVRAEAKVTKKAGKVDLILAKAKLATAKASKRKALVALIVVGIIAYYLLSSGGGVGIMEKAKSFIPFLGE